MMSDEQTGPKRRIKTSGASTKVADIVARARKMRAQGAISKNEHDRLIAKAGAVQKALAEQGGEQP